MTKGITYFFLDSQGYLHTRYSRSHTRPNYLWAVVKIHADKRRPSKSEVSYCSRLDLAQKEQARRSDPRLRIAGQCEIVRILSKEGRPATDLSDLHTAMGAL